MVAYSYRADGSVQNAHLAGCSLASGSHLVCTCAAIEEEKAAALVSHRCSFITSADQVVGMTVPVPVVHRLAEPVRGLLVQVDLRRGRPPYVVLRDDHGAEIPVQPETVRKFLPPIPVPPEEAVQFAALEQAHLAAVRYTEETGG